MTLKFKPEDFSTYPDGLSALDTIHGRAQSIFDKWLSEQQVVYGYDDERGVWTNGSYSDDGTHKARLVCIEEIKQELCKHEPKLVVEKGSHNILRWYCDLCDKNLKPTAWSEV